MRRRAPGHPDFGVVETYIALHGRSYVSDAASCRRGWGEPFAAGARVEVFYGAFPQRSGRIPEVALLALEGRFAGASR